MTSIWDNDEALRAQCAKLAARVDDTTVINLMVAVAKRGATALRQLDDRQMQRMRVAYDAYKSEAVRRGLIE